jgi:hypothetical protein
VLLPPSVVGAVSDEASLLFVVSVSVELELPSADALIAVVALIPVADIVAPEVSAADVSLELASVPVASTVLPPHATPRSIAIREDETILGIYRPRVPRCPDAATITE